MRVQIRCNHLEFRIKSTSKYLPKKCVVDNQRFLQTPRHRVACPANSVDPP